MKIIYCNKIPTKKHEKANHFKDIQPNLAKINWNNKLNMKSDTEFDTETMKNDLLCEN